MVTVNELRRQARSNMWGRVRDFYLKGRYNADGSPVRLRVSGKLRTWKTRPGDVEVPVKWGFWTSYTVGTTPRSFFKLSEVTQKEPKWRKRRR